MTLGRQSAAHLSVQERLAMKMSKRNFIKGALASASALMLFAGRAISTAFAQQRYKMSTPIPPSIPIPDSLETRLGTLSFFDGFPDKVTTEKLYDNLDFQRTVQSYLLGLPVVSQWANRKGMLEWGPANSTVPIFEQLLGPKAIFLTANDNTPYTWFWVDQHNGPLVIEVPPKVLGVIDDMWYRWVADLGITAQDKGEGGKYLLLPPGYN